MPYHEKTRVGVLRGGPSFEYEVSLKTGAAVLGALTEEYHPLDVFIDREGAWHLHGRREDPHKILGKVDAVWNALHGGYGEDGGVQHLLESHAIPFSGSRRLASAMAMNKALTRRLLAKEKIRTPYFKMVRREEVSDTEALASELYRTFPQPSVIKPATSGSSLGVSVVGTPEAICYALDLAFAQSEQVLVEEYIAGVEAVCAVVEGFRNESLYSLLPVTISLQEGSPFYDFAARGEGGCSLSSPGRLRDDEKEEIIRLSRLVHQTLGLQHYSSSDFIVHPERGIYFLEVDSLPALHSGSPFPHALQAVGVPLPVFVEHVLSLAQARK